MNTCKIFPKYDILMGDLNAFPLTFAYGGTSYKGFADFAVESTVTSPLERGTKTVVTLRHPAIPALFRLETSVYPAESAYEYAVYITNDGEADTAVFSDLSFVMTFAGKDPMISGIKGDAGGVDYSPYRHDLTETPRYLDRSVSGRPSHVVFPYYNLSYGQGGTFVAIGWPGTWYADFTYNAGAGVTTLKTGQGQFSSCLRPGETIRTPLMGLVEYEGLTPDEQVNAWRHYYIRDVMRKIDGDLTPTYRGTCNLSQGFTTESQLAMLKAYKENGVTPEMIWIDAGWYTGAKGETVEWPKTGTLDMDYSRFPDGMAEIGEFAKENGSMFLLWFEPENMRLDTEEFLRGQPDFKEEWLFDTVWEGSWLQSRILNLGNPDCLSWILRKICKVIDEGGVTGFRQDFNTDPAGAWAAYDAKSPNRTGMAENQYVQGYLAMWDALIDRYGFFIDSCASGGGRNDLETMKRGVPLHYTDYFDGNGEAYDMKGKNAQALFAWLPYFKNTVNETSLYKIRMNFAPTIVTFEGDAEPKRDWPLLRRCYADYDRIRGYFYEDYYLLTEWTKDLDRWDGRMFFSKEKGEGFISLACQEGSSTLTRSVCLKGMDPAAAYTVTDSDGLLTVTATGAELMEQGITVTVPEKPYCAILLIRPAL